MNSNRVHISIPRHLLLLVTSPVVTLLTVSLLSTSLISCSATADNTAKTGTQKSNSTSNDTINSASINSDFPYAFENVTKNTWVIHGPRELPNPENKGFMNNPGLVKTSAGLVVIDPGSTVQIGEHLLTEIKKISTQKIIAVFNTHIHGDHWLANQAIKTAYPDVKIYGHTEMISEISSGEGIYWVNLMDNMTAGASKGTIVVGPNKAVENNDIIKIGDTRFKMHHYGIAHTKTDIMIEVLENSVIFLGDNVLALRIPRTSDGTFQGNISSIKNILKSDVKTFVPGHGPTGERKMVETYLNYLLLIYKAAQQAFEEDLDSSDVLAISKKSTTAYQNWPGYDALIGPQGAQAYSEVEAAEF